MKYLELINIEILGGIDIEEAIKDSIKLAKKRNAIVSFKVNGVSMKTEAYSNFAEVKAEYNQKLKR